MCRSAGPTRSTPEPLRLSSFRSAAARTCSSSSTSPVAVPQGCSISASCPSSRTSRDEDAEVVIGAGVTFRRIERELAAEIPALATAARTVGSPQIRNRATIGGNLATASPAGDAHPVLMALGATVVVESTSGRRNDRPSTTSSSARSSAVCDRTSPSTACAPRGPVRRNTSPRWAAATRWIIATVSFALAVHEGPHRVGTGIGSAGPTPLRAITAEEYLAGALEHRWDDPAAADDEIVTQFGTLVAESARPIDDVRGSADYRARARRAGAAMPSLVLGRTFRRGVGSMRIALRVNGAEHTVDDVWACDNLLTRCASGSGCAARRTHASRASAGRAR
ncbi:MAG: FAD binding domain-containing protein [Ilumatobacteraceae bacterium]